LNKSDLRSKYADYLQSKHWDYFATVTFKRERRDSIAAIRDVWQRIGPHCDKGFLAAEPHRTGALHLHGLLEVRAPFYTMPWILQDICDREFGRSRIDGIQGPGEVANYCSKYVVKNQNLYTYEFLGDNWST